jgi:outer membrane protein OmpA-like peptidoglycan-associated protein
MRFLTVSLLAAVAVAGCATTPQPNPALENAHSAVQAAEADPNVAQYAALDLDTARKDLQAADAASLHHDEPAVVQWSYMASQSAKLAELHASAKANDARVAAGQAERDRIQLQARERETENAKLARDVEADKAAQARDAAAQQGAKAAQLQAEVDALKAKQTDRGLVLTLGDVLFDTGRATLNSGAARKLDQLVQFLMEHPDRRVEIDGFTDSVGGDSYNVDLSQRRADAVKASLVNSGIDASRVTTQGYGKEFAVASNNDAGGRQLNRRVEVVIGGENGAPVARLH